jgi:hypothetical protein
VIGGSAKGADERKGSLRRSVLARAALFTVILFASTFPCLAQSALPQALPSPQPGESVIQRSAPPEPRPPIFEEAPLALLQGLDKVTARTSSFSVRQGESAAFGALTVKVLACRRASPLDAPESAALLEISEVREGTAVLLFKGWVFASSPALSAMDHPGYDVWLKSCNKASVSARSPSKQ